MTGLGYLPARDDPEMANRRQATGENRIWEHSGAMVEDIELSVSLLEIVLSETRNSELNFAEKAGR